MFFIFIKQKSLYLNTKGMKLGEEWFHILSHTLCNVWKISQLHMYVCIIIIKNVKWFLMSIKFPGHIPEL